jgi:hypothetical protein
VVWVLINSVVLGSPFVLIWGWVKYWHQPTRSDWRSRASFVGLAAPILSVCAWGVALSLARWNGASLAQHLLANVGLWTPVLGLLVGLFGRPRLIFAIVPSSVGAVLFWFGTTLP